MSFRFKKNERGFSEITFPFMRKVVIGATNKLFNVRITHKENMPLTGPCFIFGNHSNYFDPFFLNVEMTVEPTAGVMTREQFHKFIPRVFMDSIGIVPTSKYVPEPGIIRSVMKMIDLNRMIVIFPEGGRRWDGRPKDIVNTTLKLFWKMGIPIHPVQIHGSYLSWPRWADYPRRSSVEVRWLSPIHASDYDSFESFSQTCLEKINFEEYDPPVEAVPFASLRPASGISRLLYRCPETGANSAVFSPDGHRVRSHSYPAMNYRMDHASRLVRHDGSRQSLLELFDHINSMDMIKDEDGTILQETGTWFFMIDSEHQLHKLGRGLIRLMDYGLHFSYGSENESMPFDEILTISIEQNHKLSITDSQRTLQFTIESGSALQWQLYLRRLMDGEKAMQSL